MIFWPSSIAKPIWLRELRPSLPWNRPRTTSPDDSCQRSPLTEALRFINDDRAPAFIIY